MRNELNIAKVPTLSSISRYIRGKNWEKSFQTELLSTIVNRDHKCHEKTNIEKCYSSSSNLHLFQVYLPLLVFHNFETKS